MVEAGTRRKSDAPACCVLVLSEQSGCRVIEVERRHILCVVAIMRQRSAEDPQVVPVLSGKRELPELGRVHISLLHRPEGVVMVLCGGGSAYRKPSCTRQQPVAHDSTIEAPSLHGLHVRGPRRGRAAADRTSLTVLGHAPDGHEHGATVPVIPEDPRPGSDPPEARQVCPSVAVEVGMILAVSAGQHGIAPSLGRLTGEPEDGIRPTQRGLIQEELSLVFGTPRNQVDHTPQSGRAVER